MVYEKRLRFLLLQGANLDRLGYRQPELYGKTTAAELDRELIRQAEDLGIDIDIHYCDEESAAACLLKSAKARGYDLVMMNPGGFSETGIGLEAALSEMKIPYLEIHLTNIESRQIRSVTAKHARGIVMGFGVLSYFIALNAGHEIVRGLTTGPPA